MPTSPKAVDALHPSGRVRPAETTGSDALRTGGVGPSIDSPTPVGEVIDLTISPTVPAMESRLYRPPATRHAGLTTFFHRGGCADDAIATHDLVCRDLCVNTGAAVLSVSYPRAVEHGFAAALDDCVYAVRWAAQYAHTLGVDPARIVVAGDHAGGTLAAAAALRLRDESGPAVIGQVLIYPMTNHRSPPIPSHPARWTEHAPAHDATRWCEAGSAARARRTASRSDSPLHAGDLAGLPPALVIGAGFEPQRDEGETYAHRLLDAGVPVTLWRDVGPIHGAPLSTQAKDAIERAAHWIKSLMY